MLTVSVRTLRHELVIRAPDRKTADALRFMQARPRIPHEPAEQIDIDVGRCCGFLSISLPGHARHEGTAQSVLNELHGFHFDLTRAEFSDAALIHGGCLTFAGGHTVIVGDKGAGKTTLLARLATEGWPVCGDEHVVLASGGVIPRPRSLRIKPGTLLYLPSHAREIVLNAPFVVDWQGAPVHAVEPSALGVDWVLHRRPIRNLVFLSGNHGGRSRLSRIGFDDAMARLLLNTILPQQGRVRALGEIAAVARSAHCWELRNGQLKETARHLNNAIHRLQEPPPFGPAEPEMPIPTHTENLS